MAENTKQDFVNLLSKIKRPRKKPTLSQARGVRVGDILGDNDLLSTILPDLAKDPVARLGADASIVTEVPFDTNFAGTFSRKGLSPVDTQSEVGRSIQERILATRPELVENEAIVLRQKGSITKGNTATLLHEFGHRAVQQLQDQGKIPRTEALFKLSGNANLPILVRGKGVPEEFFIRLLDFSTGRSKKRASNYFDDTFGLNVKDVENIIKDPNFIRFVQKFKLAREEKVKALRIGFDG